MRVAAPAAFVTLGPEIRTVAIVAGGPSVVPGEIALLRRPDVFTIAINNSWRLAPWARLLYACDWAWWGRTAPAAAEFAGLRACGWFRGQLWLMPRAEHCRDLVLLPTEARADELIFDGVRTGAGGNSAFQALNLAVLWGARRVILAGVDCHSPGVHWYGRDARDVQHAALMRRWIAAWGRAAEQVAGRGVEVVNASPGTAVGCFPVTTLPEALEAWSAAAEP